MISNNQVTNPNQLSDSDKLILIEIVKKLIV